MTWRLLIEPNGEGGFLGTSPDVPGLVVDAATRAECVEIAEDVAIKIKESCEEHGHTVPPALLD
jgi:antitoxin HicB